MANRNAVHAVRVRMLDENAIDALLETPELVHTYSWQEVSDTLLVLRDFALTVSECDPSKPEHEETEVDDLRALAAMALDGCTFR